MTIQLTQPSPHFYSRFGGLWTDRSDALDELERRVRSGRISSEDQPLYRHFIERGFVILQRAVPDDVISRLLADLEHAWRTGEGRFMLDILGEYKALHPSLRDTKYKLLDLYVVSEAARCASFSPVIVKFLEGIFDEPCLAFQSLSFERGTEQAMHQDTAYVVVEEPMKLAASWVALEDIQPGTGELEYYEGSHKLGDFSFGASRKHWEPGIDGPEVHMRFLQHLQEESTRRGLKRSRFLPKRGDVLIWAADLAHGGSAITDPTPTRRSLVTHYCPRSVSPHYMTLKQKERRWFGSFHNSSFCSMYYDKPVDAARFQKAPARTAATKPRPVAKPQGQSAAAGTPAPSWLPTPLRKLRAAVRKKFLSPWRRRLRGY